MVGTLEYMVRKPYARYSEIHPSFVFLNRTTAVHLPDPSIHRRK